MTTTRFVVGAHLVLALKRQIHGHGPGGSAEGSLPSDLKPCTQIHFPASFLNTYVNTKTSSFGVPLYVNFAPCMVVAYAMSVPTSSVLISISSPLLVMPSLAIICLIIAGVIGLPEFRIIRHPSGHSGMVPSGLGYVARCLIWDRISLSSADIVIVENVRGVARVTCGSFCAGFERNRGAMRVKAEMVERARRMRVECACVSVKRTDDQRDA